MKKTRPVALLLCLVNSSVLAADFSDVRTETADVNISAPVSKIEFRIVPRTNLLAGVVTPTAAPADKTILADVVLRSTAENNAPQKMGMRWKRNVPGQEVLTVNNSAHQAIIDGAEDSNNKLKISLWFEGSRWQGSLTEGYLTMINAAPALTGATLSAPERQIIAPDTYKISLEASVFNG